MESTQHSVVAAVQVLVGAHVVGAHVVGPHVVYKQAEEQQEQHNPHNLQLLLAEHIHKPGNHNHIHTAEPSSQLHLKWGILNIAHHTFTTIPSGLLLVEKHYLFTYLMLLTYLRSTHITKQPKEKAEQKAVETEI